MRKSKKKAYQGSKHGLRTVSAELMRASKSRVIRETRSGSFDWSGRTAARRRGKSTKASIDTPKERTILARRGIKKNRLRGG